MNSHLFSRFCIARRGGLLLALAAGWLLASPAGAFPIVFDGPGGYGISEESAEDAFDAGIARLTPPIFQASAFGITIPDQSVLLGSVELKNPPSVEDPSSVPSMWTVQNGSRSIQNAWLVFLRPQTYVPPFVGIDLPTTGEWGIVEVSSGETEYFYPAVRLGHLAAGGSVQVLIHHLVGAPLIQDGDTLFLPRYGIGALGTVPEPAVVSLFGALFAGLLLRRRSAA
jgi:hypothetical protein